MRLRRVHRLLIIIVNINQIRLVLLGTLGVIEIATRYWQLQAAFLGSRILVYLLSIRVLGTCR